MNKKFQIEIDDSRNLSVETPGINSANIIRTPTSIKKKKTAK